MNDNNYSNDKVKARVKRLTLDAALTAVALTVFIVELQLPPIIPAIPGIKLGLANVITLVAVFLLRPSDATAIQYTRIVVGCLFAGRVTAMAYSLAGGTLCLVVMLLCRRVLADRQAWAASVAGALAHNAGQLAVAAIMLGTPGIAAVYAPVLALAGTVAGIFTGAAATAAIAALKNIMRRK